MPPVLSGEYNPSFLAAWWTIVKNGASIVHKGNLLINLPLTGFPSFSVSFSAIVQVCFLGSLPKEITCTQVPVSGPAYINYLASCGDFASSLKKQLSAQIKVKSFTLILHT